MSHRVDAWIRLIRGRGRPRDTCHVCGSIMVRNGSCCEGMRYGEYERMLSLPLSPAHSDEDVDDVIQAVTEIVRAHPARMRTVA